MKRFKVGQQFMNTKNNRILKILSIKDGYYNVEVNQAGLEEPVHFKLSKPELIANLKIKNIITGDNLELLFGIKDVKI